MVGRIGAEQRRLILIRARTNAWRVARRTRWGSTTTSWAGILGQQLLQRVVFALDLCEELQGVGRPGAGSTGVGLLGCLQGERRRFIFGAQRASDTEHGRKPVGALALGFRLGPRPRINGGFDVFPLLLRVDESARSGRFYAIDRSGRRQARLGGHRQF